VRQPDFIEAGCHNQLERAAPSEIPVVRDGAGRFLEQAVLAGCCGSAARKVWKALAVGEEHARFCMIRRIDVRETDAAAAYFSPPELAKHMGVRVSWIYDNSWLIPDRAKFGRHLRQAIDSLGLQRDMIFQDSRYGQCYTRRDTPGVRDVCPRAIKRFGRFQF
jgi:hypothetical protein